MENVVFQYALTIVDMVVVLLRTFVLVNQDMVVHFAISNVLSENGPKIAKKIASVKMVRAAIPSMADAFVHGDGRGNHVMKNVPLIAMVRIVQKFADVTMGAAVIIFLANVTVPQDTLDHFVLILVLLANMETSANLSVVARTVDLAIPELGIAFVLLDGWDQCVRTDALMVSGGTTAR